ncbi:hypothetical protein T459_22785 [Capsicum annuum]|uniref:Uncharacterized protein n=1 Tax=Capsicum annuum TaxID=4072 RepID=A0A2G2YQH9_CAPAN|nr:hypothetical protein T459_22785 [Capsicum annuum]
MEPKRSVLTSSFDWELDIKTMAGDIHSVVKPWCGSWKVITRQLFFMTLVLRVLNKEYASEHEALKKIWDLKMELITNARADLNKKRTNLWRDELLKKMGKDKQMKKQRKIQKLVEVDENNIIDDGNHLVQCVEKFFRIPTVAYYDGVFDELSIQAPTPPVHHVNHASMCQIHNGHLAHQGTWHSCILN